MLKVGFVGWRGLVGSVLLERMQENGDFSGLECGFFSTSSPGGPLPRALGSAVATTHDRLRNAHDLAALAEHDVIVTCQGGEYTRSVHPELRSRPWAGYWIDAASTLRMAPETVLVLDPVNADVIQKGLARGRRDFCGANCTVSLMLMALGGLFRSGLVEWMTSMSYQAASGAGARNMAELAAQMRDLGRAASGPLDDPSGTALELDTAMSAAMNASGFPAQEFGVPLAGSLIPWIDKAMPGGQTREEWKAAAEGNKILGLDAPDRPAVPVDGICVRVGAMRCHAQAFTVKLTHDIPLEVIEATIGSAHPWVDVIPNTAGESQKRLTPAAVSGSLRVPVGRLHKLSMGPEYLGAFSVGDQLLWGAAEPLRRMLRILRAHLERDVPSETEAA